MIKGRGTDSRLPGRFIRVTTETDADVRYHADRDSPRPTHLHSEQCKSLITRNHSPDVPFSQSINPYRGCEHGCIYCFARPTHSYLELSPGLDFETEIFCKDNAPAVFRRELGKRGYQCQPVAIGAATDPYQPAEKARRITRQLLEICLELRHPVSLITKGSLILRDLDVLAELARMNLVSVAVSVTTLDNDLKAILEPRASAGSRRLEVIRALSGMGVPVTVLSAPVIPFINDHELEIILRESAAAGARSAGYVVLRLPHELGDLWRDWLQQHFSQRADKVMAVVRAMRQGKDYRSGWFERQTGRGQWADVIASRFAIACRKYALDGRDRMALRTDLFRPPGRHEDQLALF